MDIVRELPEIPWAISRSHPKACDEVINRASQALSSCFQGLAVCRV